MQISSKQRTRIPWIAGAGVLVLGAAGLGLVQGSAGASDDVPLARTYDFPTGETADTFQGPVGRADCEEGSSPETGDLQGQVTIADRESGRSAEGYHCNMELVGHYGPEDGFEGAEWQLARYKDQSGRQCAYYSQRTVNYGVGGNDDSANPVVTKPGTIVLDVSDPSKPTFSENIAPPGCSTRGRR